jgi:superoxide dismutase
MIRTSTIKLLIITIISAALPVMSLTAQEAAFKLPALPYAYNALEPAIDALTMDIHYSKHHATYVKNLNLAVKEADAGDYTLEELMLWAGEFSDAVRNNAGGHYNHTLFWNILGKDHPFNPSSEVGKAILATFGTADSLYTLLSKAGASRFGSGWAWLYVTPEKNLAVCSSPNQDNPIMDVSKHRGIPILGIDVWEHAYYLKYQNKRGDYLSSVLSVLNWDAINSNYQEALKSDLLRTLERETWKELAQFHEVMSQTFHPSEDGNLEPIRSRSTEMVERATALQMSNIPASFRTPEIKKALSDLVTGSEELDLMIKNKAGDKAVTSKLDSLHDTFHIIQGLCRH